MLCGADTAFEESIRKEAGCGRDEDVLGDEDRRGTEWPNQVRVVVEASGKAYESRMKFFGHVKRRGEDFMRKRVVEMNVQGRRGRGRPKLRSNGRLKKYLRETDLKGDRVMDRTSGGD